MLLLLCSYIKDPDCALWYKILIGQCDEAIYWDDAGMMEGLYHALQNVRARLTPCYAQ